MGPIRSPLTVAALTFAAVIVAPLIAGCDTDGAPGGADIPDVVGVVDASGDVWLPTDADGVDVLPEDAESRDADETTPTDIPDPTPDTLDDTTNDTLGEDADTPDVEVDTATPDTTTPDTVTPDANSPDTLTPDAATPDAATPDAATPDADAQDASGDPCELGDGTPCDDEIACTVDDACAEGVCVGRPAHDMCDDDAPCTRDLCLPDEGGCVHEPKTGTACRGEGVCDLGLCFDGVCELFDDCDDGRVCAESSCDPDSGCVFELVDGEGRAAPAFTLTDLNPRSESLGQTFAVPDPEGRVVVLVFHASDCVSCLDQGEAARLVYAELEDDPDVVFMTVDGSGSDASVLEYVTYDSDDVAPTESRWPIVRDDTTAQVWRRYCADNNDVTIVSPDGLVFYARATNFEDAPFRSEILRQIRAAKN